MNALPVLVVEHEAQCPPGWIGQWLHEEGCAVDGCEFCCTRCDSAVFLLEVLENTGAPHLNVA